MHHAVALGRPLERRAVRPQVGPRRVCWGGATRCMPGVAAFCRAACILIHLFELEFHPAAMYARHAPACVLVLRRQAYRVCSPLPGLQENAPRAAFAWGRGSEGQLGVRACEDSPAPVLVEGLKGRHVLQARGCWAACAAGERGVRMQAKRGGEGNAPQLLAEQQLHSTAPSVVAHRPSACLPPGCAGDGRRQQHSGCV